MRKIEQFLPPIYRTPMIKNFMASTTNQLFSQKDSESSTFFVGRKKGGLYNNNTDFYADEIRKQREDYQLEPTFVLRDPNTGEITNSLFYEDVLHSLAANGSDVLNHDSLFNSNMFSYSPPIDVDMFINYRNYYWYPEGITPIELANTYEDIVGRIYVTVVAQDGLVPLELSNGMFVKVSNRTETFIVNGVGDLIKLVDFTYYTENRVSYSVNDNEEDALLKYPMEYITMERGSGDDNTWSKQNMWLHRDSISHTFGDGFIASNTRRASRPIICFSKDIELYDYPRNLVTYIDLMYNEHTDANTGDLYIIPNEPFVYRATEDLFRPEIEIEIDEKSRIFARVDKFKNVDILFDFELNDWRECQSKKKPVQDILFDLFDEEGVRIADDLKYPESNFEGNKIFAYYESHLHGIYDRLLDKWVTYQSDNQSSELKFTNDLATKYSFAGGDIGTHFYKVHDRYDNDRIIRFTIQPKDDSHTIYANDSELPNILVYADTPYLLDFSDFSTTNEGWIGKYNPITIEDITETNRITIVPATHAYSLTNRHSVTFSNGRKYRYTDGTIEGVIMVVDRPNNNYVLLNEWVETGKDRVQLYQSMVVESIKDAIPIKYCPNYTDINVFVNGVEQVPENVKYRRRGLHITNIEIGDYVELFYYSNDKNVSSKDVIQLPHPSLTNNPYNEDVVDFSFSMIFDHLQSIVRNQQYLEGTPLSNNRYRDTLKDYTLGNVITKHDANFPLLQFVLQDNDINPIQAIRFTAQEYESFKQNIIIGIEQHMRDNDITAANVNRYVDDILLVSNGLKTATSPFAHSYMIASYNSYDIISLDDENNYNGVLDNNSIKNALYIYDRDGIKLDGIDYNVLVDADQGVTHFEFMFAINSSLEIRFYRDIAPTFVPPTPTKFGLSKPYAPSIIIDESYSVPVLFVRGHDGSRNMAYTDINDYNNGYIDPRDLALLDIESRIYNGIDSKFRDTSSVIIDYRAYRPGKFRNPITNEQLFNKTEFSEFHRWVHTNHLNYRSNESYIPNNPFTYNYNGIIDKDGEKLTGHWKSIYTYYYDTYRPHIMPWEMLGFDVKPTWWEEEYGDDFSTQNEKLWHDLEQGIIRRGSRSNTENGAYLLKSNIYRREGLYNYIPVNDKGDLLNPIEIGIAVEPEYTKAMSDWQFGDYGSVEQAWRNTSTYVYMMQIFMYVLDPLQYVSRTWNTSASNFTHTREIYSHSSNNHVSGLSQWTFDYLSSRQLNTKQKLVTNFHSQDIVLAHKLGGYIDSNEVRVFTESYNPRSTTNTTLVPFEDISVSMYESKELTRESYSGIIIERIADPYEVKPFTNGAIYSSGDIVIDLKTKIKYKFDKNIQVNEWMNATYYLEDREVIFNNSIYVCLQPHRATNDTNPSNVDYWCKKGFKDKEWKIVTNESDLKSTLFKVTGYDIYDPYFTIAEHDTSLYNKKFSVLTRDSKASRVREWEEGIDYSKGSVFKLPNGSVISMTTKGVTTKEPVEGAFEISDSSMAYTNTITHSIYMRPKMLDGIPTTKSIEYGRVFKNSRDVCQFIKDYGNYLEHRGWVFDSLDEKRDKISNWDLMIEDFMQWSYEAKEKGSVIMLSPSATNVKFKSKHGVPSVKRGKDNGLVVLLNHKFQEINDEATDILRLDNVFSVKATVPIYFCSVGVKEYEHAIYINNKTIFGDYNFYHLFGMRKDRFQIRTTKTTQWDGTLKANGYIIVNGSIMPNFDTSVDEIRYNTDMESLNTTNIINKLKYHNIGFRERQYFSELEMDIKSQVSFYKGFIRDKGTMNSIDRFLRNAELGNKSEIDVYEEWAINDGDFGGIANSQFIEFIVNSSDFTSNPQPLYLEYNKTFDNKVEGVLYYNIEDTARWVTRPTKLSKYDTLWDMYSLQDMEDGLLIKDAPVSSAIINAGHVRWDDVAYRVFSLAHANRVILESSTLPEIGSSVWVSNSIKNDNKWDVYQIEEAGITVDEILTVGKTDKCSFIIKTNTPIDGNGIYGIYDDNHNMTFELVLIEDNYYLGKPFSKSETNVLVNDATIGSFKIYKWVSCRTYNEDPLVYSSRVGLTLFPTTRLYTGTGEDWTVLRLANGGLVEDRKSMKKVKSNLIDSVLLYDQKTHDVVKRLRVYDPLKGIYPTNSIQYIDWITLYDPASYDSGQGFTRWGRESVGKLWWDTSKVSYIDYETGSNEYRTQMWGTMFPDSEIVINEWVEDVAPPEKGEDGEEPRYVVEKSYNYKLGVETKKYYYWKTNNKKIPNNLDRIKTANEIASDIRDGHLFNGFVAPISENALIVRTDPRTTQFDLVLQVNYRITDKSTPTYTQWTIIGETENNSDIPPNLHTKMIDSLLGYDIHGNRIPEGAEALQYVDVEKVGLQKNQVYVNDKEVANIEYREEYHDTLNSIYGNGRLQSWFKDPKEAKRIFVERINEYLLTLNWWDIEMFWERTHNIPLDSKYFRLVPWYSESYQEDSNEFISSIVDNRNALRTLNVSVGTLIRVNEPIGRMPPVYQGGWTVYRYLGDNTYDKVAQDRSTLQFTQEFIDTTFTLEEADMLRMVLDIIYEVIFVEPYRTEINKIFFAMIRYILSEQESNDWLFPTSYISLTHKSEELIQKPLFQQDREQQIRQYIEEAKPYRSKLRKYERIHTAPIEEANMYVTDFDKMPYITVDKNVINLQEDLIDKLKGDGKTTVFNTRNTHDRDSVTVYVNGTFIDSERYFFSGVREITFLVAPPKGINAPENIIVISNNNNHRPILRDFKLARGYNGVYTERLSVWLSTVNQKTIFSQYDRISYHPTLRLETIKELYDESQRSEEPRKAFTALSRNKGKNIFTESDRVLVVHYYDLLSEVVELSSVHLQGERYINKNINKDNVEVLVDNKKLPPIYYKVKKSGNGIEVIIDIDLMSHGDIIIRPKDKYNKLLESVESVIGLGRPFRDIDIWKPTKFKPEINITETNDIKMDKFTYDKDSEKVINSGKFTDPTSRGVPEEYIGIRNKETVIFTSMNNFNLVPKGYVTVKGANIFDAVRVVATNSTREIPINLNVAPDQIMVLVDGDIWVEDRHYRLEKDKLVFIRNPRTGQQIVVADKVAAFDMYYDRYIDRLKNLNLGGFDGNVVLPDSLNDKKDFREFIVMTEGKSYVFEEISSSEVIDNITHNDNKIVISEPLKDIHFTSENPTLIAIHGVEEECINGEYKVKSSITEFIMVDGYKAGALSITDRGIFDSAPKNFDLNKYKVRAYYLSIDKSLSAMIIPEPYIGNRRNHYPKYGHIVTGNDNGEC